jgi:hypothetical protein
VPPKSPLPTLLLAAGLAVAAGCAAALRHPSPRDAELLAPRWPGTTVEDLERGRALYVRRCSSCHTLVLPEAHPPAKWPGLVDAMAKKARLGPGERDDVVRFLVAVASDGEGAAGR